tara:strand:- start:1463 stop:1963 length:501 start_codon:yes stop_codon:yes gene_type:complete
MKLYTKKFKNWHLDVNEKDWISHYNALRKIEPRLVNVKSMNNKIITMKHIDNSQTLEVAMTECKEQETLMHLASQFFSVVSNLISYYKKHYFVYTDLTLDNFLCDNDTKNITLIDPDSFVLFDKNNLTGHDDLILHKTARAFEMFTHEVIHKVGQSMIFDPREKHE